MIEITSKTTQREDQHKKRLIYRDNLKVPEYFQFDPAQDYLKPPLQGFRLIDGDYVPIDPIAGRLPSEKLGLHLEQAGNQLRLFDPVAKRWIPTRRERVEQAALARIRAETERERAETERERAEAETERLRAEIEALKRRLRGEE